MRMLLVATNWNFLYWEKQENIELSQILLFQFVSFAAIATTPTIALSSKPGQRKRKQHATILTATPMKIILEDKEKKKLWNSIRLEKMTNQDQKKLSKKQTYETKILQKKNFTRKFFRERRWRAPLRRWQWWRNECGWWKL